MSYKHIPLGKDNIETVTSKHLGSGYRLHKAADSPLFVNIQEKDIRTSWQTYAYKKFSMIESASSLMSTLKVEIGGSVKILIFTGGAAVQFYEENISNEHEIVLTYIQEQVIRIDDINESADIQLAAENMTAESIANIWGFHYISGLVYGSTLQVNFHLRNSSTQTVSGYKAIFRGEIDLLLFSIKVEKVLIDESSQSSTSKTELSVDANQRGGIVTERDMKPSTITEAMDLIKKYQTDDKFPAVVGYRIKPIPLHRVQRFAAVTSLDIQNYERAVRQAAAELADACSQQAVVSRNRKALSQEARTMQRQKSSSEYSAAFSILPQTVTSVTHTLENKVQHIRDYLNRNAFEICRTTYKPLAEDINFRSDYEAISGDGVLYFKLHNTDVIGRYTGYISQGKAIFRGTFESPEGSYTGNWCNNKRHGYGVMKWADGKEYEGEWEDDVAVQNN